MTVLNIAITEIRDAGKMQAYIEAAAPLMKEFGVEIVLRGRYLKSLLGEQKSNHVTGIFRFASINAAEEFYSCERYLALISLREEAGKMTFNFYEE